MMGLRTTLYGFIGIFVIMLVGCGGGGGGTTSSGTTASYTGATTPAAITAGNAKEVGVATTEAAAQAVNKYESPFGVAITEGSSSALSAQQIRDIVRRVRENLPQNNNLPMGVTYTSDQLNAQLGTTFFCGGTVDGPADLNADTGTLTYHDICFDDGSSIGQVIINGTFSFSYSTTATGSTDTSTYSDLSITFNGHTQTLNGTETCTEILNPYSYTCTSTESYVGDDGLTYQFKDGDVTGDASGYYVTATVYHPTYGYVTVTTTVPITFIGCSNGKPNAGEISFSGSGGTSGSITFDSCTGYTVSYDDGSGVVNTISGTW